MTFFRFVSIVLLSFLPTITYADTTQLGLKLPDGFTVSQYAGEQLANDIYTMTVDPKGRIVVAGRGYIRILVDDNNDGRADRAIQFADSPKDGAMGMLWEGDTLYVTGDGGLRQFRDRNGDDRADGPPELIRRMKTGGEHHAHAIRRGPDGWLYVMCGNYTGIDKSFAQLPTSPVKDPVGGCVVRFTPDLKKSEIFAHGFRNAYDMDFNPDGELFTYDSDNERCIALPWYEYTRFYHVMSGGYAGWFSPQRAKWWRCPPHFVDIVAPLTTLDRGSPTGVACYRHVQFPKKYHGALIACDWTFGRIWLVRTTRQGASYKCKKELFIQSVGDNGFAPTDVVVHPKTGDLFISIGGRGTRGAVYRIRHKKSGKIDPKEVAKLQPKRRELPLTLSNSYRKRFLTIFSDVGGLPLYYFLSHVKRIHAISDKDVERKLIKTIALAHANKADKHVRRQVADLLRGVEDEQWSLKQLRKLQGLTPRQTRSSFLPETFGLAWYDRHPKEVLSIALRRSTDKSVPQRQLEAIRIIQLALGGVVAKNTFTTVWEGYTARLSRKALLKRVDEQTLAVAQRKLSNLLPTDDALLNLEVTRTLAMLEDDNATTMKKVADLLIDSEPPTHKLHYLIVLARLKAKPHAAIRQTIAEALIDVNRQIRQAGLYIDRHWPLRIGELVRGLAKRDPQLNSAILNHRSFGCAEHALFTKMPGFDRKKAAARFLGAAKDDPGFAWNGDVVNLIGLLPREHSLPVLRSIWGKAGVDDAVLPLLAKRADKQDRDKFLRGLQSTRLTTVQLSLQALNKLPSEKDEQLPLLLAMKRFPGKEGKQLRRKLGQRLEKLSAEKHGDDLKAWTQWFTKAHPKLAKRLNNPDGVDLTKWHRRLQQLKWSEGNAPRGLVVFRKANCVACHSGRRSLGPDLKGVGKRFSRDDLMTAILQPSRDVPQRYQATLVATRSGKVYQGLKIYEANDSMILQTDADKTKRILGKQIIAQRRVATSLMPAGLLDELNDREIVDLMAYLRSLK